VSSTPYGNEIMVFELEGFVFPIRNLAANRARKLCVYYLEFVVQKEIKIYKKSENLTAFASV
jgi:hypothetical protein